MCGRAYETYSDEELEIRYLNKKKISPPLDSFKPNFNMCPTQLSPIVLEKNGERTIELLRWGMIPFWAKDIKSASQYSLINAKGEEITEKRSYKAPFEKRRCIVPLSGFYEWLRPKEGPKKPFAIQLKDEPIMSVAGVWEHWESKETKEVVESFSIITTAANSVMKKIHDRMPVILDKSEEEYWLDSDNQDVNNLKKLLKPCPSTWLEAFEVSTLVNSPRNNSKKVLEPI